jgi:hypothetical protein
VSASQVARAPAVEAAPGVLRSVMTPLPAYVVMVTLVARVSPSAGLRPGDTI